MKAKVVARCQDCGAETPRWVGRCPECGAWGTVVEEPVSGNTARPVLPALKLVPLADHAAESAERVPSGIDEVDRVLGGGLVRGSVVLLAGEPGVGKSTLVLQIAAGLGPVALVCGEESPQQVYARAARLGDVPAEVTAASDPSLGAVLAAVSRGGTVVVDSIQTVFDQEIASAPGSVAQVRECGARLARAARDAGTTLLLVGHVTKEGTVAGPRVLEHLVDVVLTFEGDRRDGIRILRAQKNRFGSTQEAGFFEMSAGGLRPIRDASAWLLADRCTGLPGSVLASTLDGRRPFVCEVQALVDPTKAPVPRRVAQGVDASRLVLLAAVLKRAGLSLGENDVYVSAVGGLQLLEPAADLPVALALISASVGIAFPDDLVAFGEIGLAGEVRQSPGAERRLQEAVAVGCKRAVVPAGTLTGVRGIEIVRIRRLQDAMETLGDR